MVLHHVVLVGNLLERLGLNACWFEGSSFEVEISVVSLSGVQHQIGLLEEVLVVAIVSRLLLLFIFFFVIVVSIIVRKLVLLLERTWMEVELAVFAVLRLEH